MADKDPVFDREEMKQFSEALDGNYDFTIAYEWMGRPVFADPIVSAMYHGWMLHKKLSAKAVLDVQGNIEKVKATVDDLERKHFYSQKYLRFSEKSRLSDEAMEGNDD